MPDDFGRRGVRVQGGEYLPAIVCRRGHTYSSAGTLPPAERCAKCGAQLLANCPNCSTALRGRYYQPGVVMMSASYTPPNFCFSCGDPFPWASRQARIWELHNILDEQELDSADRLVVQEQLEALMAPDLDEEEQVRRWAKVRDLAPGVLQAGARIAESVITGAIRRELGI